MSVDRSYFLRYLAESKAAHSEIVHGAHVVSTPFVTPAPNADSEDRYVVEKWILLGESWTFAAVFDNSLLPDDLSQVSPDHAEALAFRDPSSADSKFCIKVLRALSGTVALVDPSSAVHLASVGDCDAFVCPTDSASSGWEARSLGPRHNCSNPAEAARVRAEHFREELCETPFVPDGLVSGVLGRITLSRAPGDMPYKLPIDYMRLVSPVQLSPALAERNPTRYRYLKSGPSRLIRPGFV
ncbi:hypothetical protein D9757_004048 [Collybiopsis confluens]|uniref:PPM-type phosphatase domain-containing protein n=1 Tax=Collybiopsis confluens TaxID=2823264 RepID=A0A8H5HX03_9AGAR|nr:hypothetical protein D9757_004048 [Collybiopsis confluens]